MCLYTLRLQMNNFHPLEVMGRGSETQLQVGENVHSTAQPLTALYHLYHRLWVTLFVAHFFLLIHHHHYIPDN